METEDVCSSASKKGKYRTIVNIDKDSSISVSYVIIPMTLGNHMIEVKASAYDSVHTDGVRKMLNVVSEGVLTTLHRENVELNPAKNGEKTLVFKSEIPADRLPETPANMYISITAREITQTVEQVISGDPLDCLIIPPSDSGWPNMFCMIQLIVAIHYLDCTNQWEAVGMERRNEAINYISKGYQQQLAFRKSDGSYFIPVFLFGTDPSGSTYWTVFAAKVFTMAYDIVPIDDNVICSALKWLILHGQKQDGSFNEGDAETEDGFTAVCVITMQEGKKICAESFGIEVSVRKAVSFLEGRLPKQTDTLTVAFTSYAMASANKLNKDILMKHSTHGEDGRSWTATGQSYSSVHVTAFAMLALVKAKDFDKAREAVHWLKKQQDPKGGYGDPLGTIFVLWAMREYHMLMKDQQNLSLDVELSIAGRSKPVKYTFKNDNRPLTWSSKVDINKDFNVTARGTGTATLSVLTLYYTRLTEKKSDCTFFDLTVKMEKDPETKQGAIETYKLTMDFHYKSDKTDATMTILDIGLLTGFNVDATDLKELSTGKERYIQKFEMNKVLSERGSLILYLDKVLREYPQRISFRVHKMLNVGLLQPAAVTIYEYYSPDRRCTKFYHRERTDGALYKLCKGDLCYCAEENCSFQKKNQVSDVEHLNKACEAGMDYVYKVTVVGMDLQQTVDTYDMKVEQVLREGTDEEVEGKVRQFLARPRCREHLGLIKGKSYLIMGKSVDLPNHGG
ncbi:complement C3, partial [Labeo rohita]|uniref:complement C3 n=1 Tax=Labeo rohita TaxID=84645 RepID=UPI0021E2A6FF